MKDNDNGTEHGDKTGINSDTTYTPVSDTNDIHDREQHCTEMTRKAQGTIIHADELEFRFLCIDLRTLPSTLRFLLCCGGVFVFYCLYGYFQELLFRIEDFKPYGWYLTLLQFALYSAFGLGEFRLQGQMGLERKISLPMYALIAFLTVATIGLSNSSLGYLNYPTQVIFKCCKLIPVLIGGIAIQGKTFSLIDVIACLCMSIGLIFFTLADSSVSPTFSLYGIFLISLALCADAIIGNVQEKAMKATHATNSEMVVYSYSIGFLYILFFQVLSGQLWYATIYCLETPQIFVYIFLFSLSGYLGVNVVLNLVKIYGALIAVTVTTCRKALTIVLSFMLFTKPFTSQYVWSGLIVVIGIYLNIYSKNRSKWDPYLKSWLKGLMMRNRQIVEGLERVV